MTGLGHLLERKESIQGLCRLSLLWPSSLPTKGFIRRRAPGRHGPGLVCSWDKSSCRALLAQSNGRRCVLWIPQPEVSCWPVYQAGKTQGATPTPHPMLYTMQVEEPGAGAASRPLTLTPELIQFLLKSTRLKS